MNDEELMTLHRHYMWCNIIKKNFEKEIQKSIDTKSKVDIEAVMPDYYGAYMSIWYGMLFGVLEVFKNKEINILEIENDINDVYDSLRLYRNAVFHPQPQYWSPKLLEIMKDKHSAEKIWKIHNRLGKYFLDEMRGRTELRKAQNSA